MTGQPWTAEFTPLSKAKEKLLGKLEQRKHREQEGLFLVEGLRLVEEALAAGLTVEWAVLDSAAPDESSETGARTVSLVRGLKRRGVSVYSAGERVLRRELDLARPQALLAVCRIPESDPGVWNAPERALIAVCDGLNNPGNLGSLVRVAAAAGVDAGVLSPGTVDPWNPRCVRGSMGALFRLPVFRFRDDAALAGFLKHSGFSLFEAAAGGEDIFDLEEFPRRSALVFGSEAHGVSFSHGDSAVRKLSVPMAAGVESLNVAVAAGIMFYRMRRRI